MRMYGYDRGPTGFGYSLWEFEVYDTELCEVPEPQVRPPDPVPSLQTLFFDNFENGADPASDFSGAWNVIGDILGLFADQHVANQVTHKLLVLLGLALVTAWRLVFFPATFWTDSSWERAAAGGKLRPTTPAFSALLRRT